VKTANAEDPNIHNVIFQSECGFPYHGNIAEQNGVLHRHFEDSSG
jgi:hypothetical protein